MVTLSSLVTSVATSGAIGIVIICAFLFLQHLPYTQNLYFPARIVRGEKWPPARRRPIFQFVWDVFKTSEYEIVALAGLDTAVYLLFLRTCLFILLWASIYCIPVLIPFCRTDDFYRVNNAVQTNSKNRIIYTDFDLLGMGNVTPKSKRLWAFAVGAYWVSLGTLFFLLRTYNHVSDLRAKFRDANESRAEKMAVLVRDIPSPPKGMTPAQHVDEFMSRLHGQVYLRSLLVPNLRKARKAKKNLDKTKLKLAKANTNYEWATAAGTAKVPTARNGFCGILGKKQDARHLYAKKREEEVLQLAEAQQEVASHAGGHAAIAFFANPLAAAAGAQCVHAEDADRWTTCEAPEPRDVLWENLAIPNLQRTVRRFIVYGIMFLTVCFYTVPISLVSAFTSLDNLKKNLPFLRSILSTSTANTVIGAYLPQLALLIFLAVLPHYCNYLSRLEGIPCYSHVTRAASGKMFYFQVFNTFLGVTLSGTLFKQLEQTINNPTSIVNKLGTALPENAAFFVTYIALKFLITKGIELMRLIPLLLYLLKRNSVRTEGELLLSWKPRGFKYIQLVAGDELIITLGLCYAIITPLILPFSTAYFAYSWLVMKNQAINVIVPEWESRGRMWPHMHARLCAALLVSQITLVGYFGIKKFVGAAALAPLPIITLLYFFYARSRFYRVYATDPLEVVAADMKRAPEPEDMLLAYVPSCLLPDDGHLDPKEHKGLPPPSSKNRDKKVKLQEGHARLNSKQQDVEMQNIGV